MYTEAVKYRFFLTVLQRKAIALALACCTKKVELIIISGWQAVHVANFRRFRTLVFIALFFCNKCVPTSVNTAFFLVFMRENLCFVFSYLRIRHNAAFFRKIRIMRCTEFGICHVVCPFYCVVSQQNFSVNCEWIFVRFSWANFAGPAFVRMG